MLTGGESQIIKQHDILFIYIRFIAKDYAPIQFHAHTDVSYTTKLSCDTPISCSLIR